MRNWVIYSDLFGFIQVNLSVAGKEVNFESFMLAETYYQKRRQKASSYFVVSYFSNSIRR